jgi:enoyl-CoA hydratase/carnithine racemase
MFLSRYGIRSLSGNLARLGSRISNRTTGLQAANPLLCRNFSMALEESYENIIVEKPEEGGGRVAVIKLNRPKALNALNDALFADLIHATSVLDDSEDIRCMVLTGSTPKAFAAGADISEMKSKTFEEAYTTDMFAEWQEISKLGGTPIIAAVSGYCLGGGSELAMMCDIVVCSKDAKFGQPEINLGVIPGAGGTQRLTRAIGKSKAMHLCLTGDMMTSDEAYASGLVAKVYENDELLPQSIAMASKIASKGRASLRAAKEAVNAADELSLAEGLRFERRLFQSLFATDDQKEGMAAFLDKRKPEFK